MKETLEAQAPQVVRHLGGGIGTPKQCLHVGAQLAVAKAPREMREAGQRLTERHDPRVAETKGRHALAGLDGRALHTVERLKRNEDGIDYEITIEDPNVFVAPFTVNRTFRFNVPPMKRIFEFVCENNRDYRPLFGTQQGR